LQQRGAGRLDATAVIKLFGEPSQGGA
jgi:hypothetical protein